MVTTALALFVAGLLTILLPCILPLLPIVLGVSVAGQDKRRPLIIVSGMVLSFVGSTFVLQVLLSQFVSLADIIRIATFYALLLFGLGFVTSHRFAQLTGAIIGSFFFWEKGMIVVIIAMLAGCLAMEMAGWIASRIQQFGAGVQGSARTRFGSHTLVTAFVIGLTLGLVWVPCAGPALGFALALVRERPGVEALLALTAYALGTAVPLLLIGYGGQVAVHSVRAVSRYGGMIKRAAGLILILCAVAFQMNVFTDLQAWVTEHANYGGFAARIEESLFRFFGIGTGASVPEPQGVLDRAFDESHTSWLNSPPLTAAELKGKVVLVDFWTYSCINCIRTLPYIQRYWTMYKDAPFVLIGVHTPEFIFEKDRKNVAAAIAKYGLTYPVVQDNDFEIWNTFDNHYWPAKYLFDAQGKIRYTHFGEGQYEETNDAIASLLREIGVDAESSVLPEQDARPRRAITAETYLNPRSDHAFGNRRSGDEALPISYEIPAALRTDAYYLGGEWKLVDEEYRVLTSNDGEIALRFRGGECNLVLGSQGGDPVTADVFIDGEKTKTIVVEAHDLYSLYAGDYAEHELRLKIHGKGLEAYAFTFGT